MLDYLTLNLELEEKINKIFLFLETLILILVLLC